ncbi:hypothetical protein H0H87_002820 [Tephrocybe sp. NHM501043]|nr:hypothetical protein H0H87_002820 [Tephrocybe sp. NHM501043]
MHATLPSLPPELLSLWKQQLAPMTPPMSATFQQRRMPQLSLPPIAHIDRQIAARAPLTPPEDVFPPNPPPRLADEPDVQEPPFALPRPDAPYTDWLDVSRARPAHFIAEKTCEMICYLWFATAAPEHSYPTPTSSPPSFSQRPNPSTTTLQLVATPTFVQFMQKLLETTQVSQSVIVLSLHYIYRLKDRNRFTPAQPGSEFRIAVAGLMMANKFLDDNTYTNKTWAEVSGIELAEINRMEREFLMGVDFNLYVDKMTYGSWLNLLKGLVLAKERDSLHFKKTRSAVRAAKHSILQHGSTGPATRTVKYRTASHHHPHRARSTSPCQTRRTATYAEPASPSPAPAPGPRSGSKRSAATAFSPTTACFAHPPSKRPVPTTLQIPEYAQTNSAPHSHSPLEGLQSFATMSLASPHVRQPAPQQQQQQQQTAQWAPAPRQAPETLVTPYSVTEERRTAVPQNLYFYTLACSPMDREEESRARKARLRYHQPPAPALSSTAQAYYHPHHARPSRPPVVQSASTSPHEMHYHLLHHAQPVLPHFHDTRWSRLPPVQQRTPATVRYAAPTTTTQVQQQQQQQQQHVESPVPSAPFANAGPPGVQFYPTPVVQSDSSLYPPLNSDWARGRRF